MSTNSFLELGSHKDNEAALKIAEWQIECGESRRGREILLRLQRHIYETKEKKSRVHLLSRIKAALLVCETREQRYPGIFISHRHVDKDVARAVAILIETAFVIEKEDIRCTSVYPL